MRLDEIKLITELHRRDMTQAQLASLAGMSRATVCGIIAGRKCSASSAEKIAAALQMNVDDLLV